MKIHRLLVILLLSIMNLLEARYYSQSGQDQYLNEKIFQGKRNGVFVDIGAHDGVTLSNTFFFESELGWSGICVEPIPVIFQQLEKNRSSICVQGCIGDTNKKDKFLYITSDSEYTRMLSGILSEYDPRHLARIDLELQLFGGEKQIIEIDCYRLDTILKAHNIHHIDYLSVDVEGSEMKVLRSIDFAAITIDVITIENNYGEKDIELFLIARGYKHLTKLEGDDIYIRTR